jgi:hypothetical protein
MTAASKIEHIKSILSEYDNKQNNHLKELMQYHMMCVQLEIPEDLERPITLNDLAETLLFRIQATLDIPKDL